MLCIVFNRCVPTFSIYDLLCIILYNISLLYNMLYISAQGADPFEHHHLRTEQSAPFIRFGHHHGIFKF